MNVYQNVTILSKTCNFLSNIRYFQFVAEKYIFLNANIPDFILQE
jgi:hypothetical protein